MLLVTGIGCVISALAPNVEVLMIGRVLQGVAGPVVPLCLIMLHQRVTEDARYARLMAILTSVNGGIAGVDAILGGWLAGNFGFRSVFVVMAAGCGSCGRSRVRAHAGEHRRRNAQDGLGWRGHARHRVLGDLSCDR